ncbi:hypothetical protein KM043_017470 [Ampulex compressa]|nr:hypothetical protein KM043_017470 [Ampulex compressa]
MWQTSRIWTNRRRGGKFVDLITPIADTCEQYRRNQRIRQLILFNTAVTRQKESGTGRSLDYQLCFERADVLIEIEREPRGARGSCISYSTYLEPTLVYSLEDYVNVKMKSLQGDGADLKRRTEMFLWQNEMKYT